MTLSKKELTQEYKKHELFARVVAPGFVRISGKDPVTGKFHQCLIYKGVVNWLITPLISNCEQYSPFKAVGCEQVNEDYYVLKERALGMWKKHLTKELSSSEN